MKCLCPGVFMTFSLMRAYIIFNPFELARLLTYHIIWGQSVLPASVWTLAKWLIIRVKLASVSSLYSYSFAVTHFYTSGRKPRTKYQSLSHLKKTPINGKFFSLWSSPTLLPLFCFFCLPSLSSLFHFPFLWILIHCLLHFTVLFSSCFQNYKQNKFKSVLLCNQINLILA